MNAARALGNIKDHYFIPVLAESLSGNPSEMVRGMCAWDLGRIGGRSARHALKFRLKKKKSVSSSRKSNWPCPLKPKTAIRSRKKNCLRTHFPRKEVRFDEDVLS
ncbi:MAG: HEAT repeat domain-containing protein [Syntrophales bacterium]